MRKSKTLQAKNEQCYHGYCTLGALAWSAPRLGQRSYLTIACIAARKVSGQPHDLSLCNRTFCFFRLRWRRAFASATISSSDHAKRDGPVHDGPFRKAQGGTFIHSCPDLCIQSQKGFCSEAFTRHTYLSISLSLFLSPVRPSCWE